jgi:hypothetical protein
MCKCGWIKNSLSTHMTCAPFQQIPDREYQGGGLFSPCDMNLSASQHFKTPQERKRLFVKVQSYNPGTPGNKKEDHSLPIQKGA